MTTERPNFRTPPSPVTPNPMGADQTVSKLKAIRATMLVEANKLKGEAYHQDERAPGIAYGKLIQAEEKEGEARILMEAAHQIEAAANLAAALDAIDAGEYDLSVKTYHPGPTTRLARLSQKAVNNCTSTSAHHATTTDAIIDAARPIVETARLMSTQGKYPKADFTPTAETSKRPEAITLPPSWRVDECAGRGELQIEIPNTMTLDSVEHVAGVVRIKYRAKGTG